MSFDLSSYIEARRTVIEEALNAEAQRFLARAPGRLGEAMAYSLLGGGKRLRPILCLASFDACRGPSERRPMVLDFCVALELIHTYSLVHDDLPAMDDDDLRRGRPTSHKAFGEATAILAGDALLTEAFRVIADGGAEAERTKFVATLARAAGAEGMVGGQELDLLAEGSFDSSAESGREGMLAKLAEIHRRKTGALISCSVEGGAMAAQASANHLSALTRFGEIIGLAFQIADDILDVVGDPSNMGKRGRGDQKRAKLTYPSLVGLDEARLFAARACEDAVAALVSLGAEGQPLRALARYAVERDR